MTRRSTDRRRAGVFAALAVLVGTGALLPSEATGASGVGAVAASATQLHGENLIGASCLAARSCTAVGSFLGKEDVREGLVLTENEGNWRSVSDLPLPTTTTASPVPTYTPALSDVSCWEVKSCLAIGSYTESVSATSPGVIFTDNNGSWSSLAAPLPLGVVDPDESLKAVSCLTPSACVIVGSYRSSPSSPTTGAKGRVGLILTETNGVWSAENAPLPSDAYNQNSADSGSSLVSVSCPAPGNCTAVGTYITGSGSQQGLVATDSNGLWTAAAALLPTNGDSVVALDGISCSAVGACRAVGTYDSDGSPLGYELSMANHEWQIIKPPQPTLYNGLYAVDCPIITKCLSIGVFLDPVLAQQGFVLSGPLERLAIARTPLPNGWSEDPGPGFGTTLSGVSCAGGRCIVVGTYVSVHRQRGILLSVHPFPTSS